MVKSFEKYEIKKQGAIVSAQIHLLDGQVDGDLKGYAMLQIVSASAFNLVKVHALKITDASGKEFFLAENEILNEEAIDEGGRQRFYYYLSLSERMLPFQDYHVSADIILRDMDKVIPIKVKGVIKSSTQKRNSFLYGL
jgi:hypothetical protein